MLSPRSFSTKILFILLTAALVLLVSLLLRGDGINQTSDIIPVPGSSVSTANAAAKADSRTSAASADLISATQQSGGGASSGAPQQSTGAAPEASNQSTTEPAQRTLADVLSVHGTDMSDPAVRARVVEEMRALETGRKAAAWTRADREGLPKRIEHTDGTIQELVDFEGDKPVYFTTNNVNAAISSGADFLPAPPYAVTGSGLTVGVWDGGSVRSTHQEFGGRVTVKDGAAAVDHATHVGGTVAAAGTVSLARGMATGARIDSYEWNSDKSEMTSRGASYPGEPGSIYLSNHSYGYIAGWNRTGLSSPKWDWWGSGTASTGVEDDFGKYNSYARDSDSLSYSLPYFLVFRAAGNDRGDNPVAGDSVALSPNGTTVLSYDTAQHPAGDSQYKSGGYDTIAFDAVAKNVITVGGVNDAVSGNIRQPSNATMTWFSTWGPTDDGRIKPDLVANGESVYSSLAGSNSSYGFLSGTSMATPSATGSAALLVNFFDRLFPGQAMRASTLKALLIHTADDRGPSGPDYQYGWGLMNVKAAADLIQEYRDDAGTKHLIEDRLTTARTSVSHSFTYNGAGPIRVTLCWTDPAGSATTSGENRTARLVNNLDLQLTGPDGSVHQPYVMPYVGDWTAAKLSAPAVTGKNDTDNVEQVYIATPPAAGVYTATVTIAGTLTNASQTFSLVVSGSVPSAAPAPSATAVSPDSGNGGTVAMTITGGHFLLSATVKLSRAGEADVLATGVEVLGDVLKARVNTAGIAPGLWNVVITNPDGQSAVLPNAFSIVGAIWSENLESGAVNWMHTAQTGTDAWALTTTQSHSPTQSFFSPGAATKADTALVSPALSIPSGSSNLRLTFWHSYDLQSGRDGGVLEFSLNGGTWFDVSDSTSGAAFAAGGYNSTLSNSGKPSDRNPLAGRRAWSGKSNGFTQVAVDLTDAAKYSGKSLRIRWRLATDNGTGSTGWYVDSFTLAGAVPGNLPPSILSEPALMPLSVTGTETTLSVQAEDDAGENNLTYTWTAIGDFTAPVTFSDNGTHSASATTASFSKAGPYTFTVVVRDGEGLTATTSVEVLVEQTLSAMSINPKSITVGAGSIQQFTATALDQFGNTLALQPTFTWSASGGGSINGTGLFTAGTDPSGPHTITAATDSLSANASVMISGPTFTVWQTSHFTSEEITAGNAEATTDIDSDGQSNLMEYALGTDPRVQSAHAAYTVGIEPDGNTVKRLTLTFSRPKA